MPGFGGSQPGRCAEGAGLKYAELPLVMNSHTEPLVGIVSRPEQPCALGLVVVVGGPQYRVGSHRQFVLLARRLAQSGFAVLRFDYRGMGDSQGAPRSFESIDDDIALAVNALQQSCPEVTKVVLWGLCDGAAASLLYTGRQSDDRIGGLCLLNPWVRSDSTLARTRLKHYYGDRLLHPDFWSRLWRGQLAWRQSLAELIQSVRALRLAPDAVRTLDAGASFQNQMAFALRRYEGQVLLILSEPDTTAQEFLECASTHPDWQGLLQRPNLQRVDVVQADHTFSTAEWRAAAEQAVLQWMTRLAAAP